MLPESMVKTHLSLASGKYSEPPNIVTVPADRKRFPIDVLITMECPETYVLGTPDRQHVHEWCVLDANLKQVMRDEVRHGHAVGRRAHSFVSRTVMGGGAPNPDEFTIELTAAKLKHGATYTLICTVFGVLAALDFTAVRQPRAEARKKAAGKPKARKAAAKRKPKKKGKRAA